MIKETYFLKNKINEKGFYASISIEVELKKEKKITLLIADEYSEWETSVRFGVQYFFEHFKQKHHCGFDVKVVELRTMIVDTTSIVVVYSTIKALEKALGQVEGCNVEIDSNGDFTLSK